MPSRKITSKNFVIPLSISCATNRELLKIINTAKYTDFYRFMATYELVNKPANNWSN